MIRDDRGLQAILITCTSKCSEWLSSCTSCHAFHVIASPHEYYLTLGTFCLHDNTIHCISSTDHRVRHKQGSNVRRRDTKYASKSSACQTACRKCCSRCPADQVCQHRWPQCKFAYFHSFIQGYHPRLSSRIIIQTIIQESPSSSCNIHFHTFILILSPQSSLPL